MFGIFFLFNPNLSRILTDYGFKGYPLRKDFPLTGYFEIFYNDLMKSIVFSKISLSQDYRNFSFHFLQTSI
jgi:NADH-quinone oxidoreductase subunit C